MVERVNCYKIIPTIIQGLLVSAIGRSNDIPNATITTNSADADYVYIDDGNSWKKITPTNLGIGGGSTNDLNLTLPLYYQRDSLGSNAYDLRAVAAALSGSSMNAYPMAAAGKVIAVSFQSAGTSIAADANNQTFEVRTNGGSGTNIQFSRNDMTNTNGNNYTYTATGLSIAFNANDVLQIRRTAGSLVFGHIGAILYIKYD